MKSSWPLLALLIAGCTPSTEVVEGSSSTAAINAEAPYLWGNKSFPKSIGLSNAFSSDEKISITQMGEAWTTSVSATNAFFSFSNLTNNSYNLERNDGVLGVYKVYDWNESLTPNDQVAPIAITQLFGRRYNTGTANEYVSIEHADILVNYDDFLFSSEQDSLNKDPIEYDLRTVILHEMGHFLGLSHIPVYSLRPSSESIMSRTNYKASSVMYPSIDFTEIKRVPQTKDTTVLSSKYSISGLAASAIAVESPYKPNASDLGKNVKVVIELMPNGVCHHKMDGVSIGHHSIKLK
jgi:hypothetical protein